MLFQINLVSFLNNKTFSGTFIAIAFIRTSRLLIINQLITAYRFIQPFSMFLVELTSTISKGCKPVDFDIYH